MTKFADGRPDFRDWVDQHPDPGWPPMPLTHITKALLAADIAKSGHIAPSPCDVFNKPLTYFFYGRPAYRVSGDGAIKLEAACPCCFIFNAKLIEKADAIFAFDTGAFSKRLYKHMLTDEMNVEDFNLGTDVSRPNKLIMRTFGSRIAYFQGDVYAISDPTTTTKSYDFHARSYLNLLTSPGRNEPDDRICSIEIILAEQISLKDTLFAIIVPHTLWDDGAPWLKKLQDEGAIVKPYCFVPGRHPDYYQAQLEAAAKELYEKWSVI
ncbi:hypothetical protein I6F33_10235 [Bradyrhizobium sp. BRP20]|uniref:hypothetical protein n=1 Tax=Bradyrhizobium sp. BRP20 TaxID=2793822 RepID=UPI001CD23DBE|nr:hypothetical protein [Bradyrhizobium sp. BRP20]MCA1433355.1 hypothetical protein [Bradyrhizobium sp. BRP20]